MQPSITLLHNDIDDDFATEFHKSDLLAWDIETSGLDPKSDHIASVQLHAPATGTVVVRTGAIYPQRLCELLALSSVQKIFHHAMFDLRFMAFNWHASKDQRLSDWSAPILRLMQKSA